MLSTNEIDLIKDVLNQNGVIAVPTDTVWGLACLPENKEAVKKIYELKHRNEKKPLILMSSNFRHLIPYVKSADSFFEKICSRYFPGELTVITQKSGLTKPFITSNMDTVGIRVPNHPVFAQIAEQCSNSKVLATTSANISDFLPALKKQEVLDYFGDKIDYIVNDESHALSSVSSTIIKIISHDFEILRQGSVVIERDEL